MTTILPSPTPRTQPTLARTHLKACPYSSRLLSTSLTWTRLVSSHCMSHFAFHVTQVKDVPLVELMYRVFTCMPGESYRRPLRSLLCLCNVFRARINSLVCWLSVEPLCVCSVLCILSQEKRARIWALRGTILNWGCLFFMRVKKSETHHNTNVSASVLKWDQTTDIVC